MSLKTDIRYKNNLLTKVNTDAIPTIYQTNEAFCQLVIVPTMILTPVFVDSLTETERGDGGFGSTTKTESNEPI